jgi:hypothetical protein
MQWLEFLAGESRRLRREAWDDDRAQARQDLLTKLASNYRFPLRATFKGYVVRQRVLQIPRLEAHVAGQRTVGEANVLEVVPTRYPQEAYALVGGVLVPSERRLQPGSVLELTVDVLDPAGYRLYPPGLLSEIVECKVVVAVEA